MATDMEDLYQYHLENGAGRSEAARAVEEQFDLSEEALKELIHVHSSPLQRSLDGLSGQARRPWERGVLALLALVVAPGLALHLLQPSILRTASPLVFVLLALLVLAFGIGLRRAFSLFRPGFVPRGALPRQGIRSLPGLALLLLGLGFSGVWVELYRTFLIIREGPQSALPYLVHWLHMASATLVVALSGALLTGLLWFLLEARSAQLEERATARLMDSA
jgi:hypothetical protein